MVIILDIVLFPKDFSRWFIGKPGLYCYIIIPDRAKSAADVAVSLGTAAVGFIFLTHSNEATTFNATVTEKLHATRFYDAGTDASRYDNVNLDFEYTMIDCFVINHLPSFVSDPYATCVEFSYPSLCLYRLSSEDRDGGLRQSVAPSCWRIHSNHVTAQRLQRRLTLARWRGRGSTDIDLPSMQEKHIHHPHAPIVSSLVSRCRGGSAACINGVHQHHAIQ